MYHLDSTDYYMSTKTFEKNAAEVTCKYHGYYSGHPLPWTAMRPAVNHTGDMIKISCTDANVNIEDCGYTVYKAKEEQFASVLCYGKNMKSGK
jgi:hypothetical protein